MSGRCTKSVQSMSYSQKLIPDNRTAIGFHSPASRTCQWPFSSSFPGYNIPPGSSLVVSIQDVPWRPSFISAQENCRCNRTQIFSDITSIHNKDLVVGMIVLYIHRIVRDNRVCKWRYCSNVREIIVGRPVNIKLSDLFLRMNNWSFHSVSTNWLHYHCRSYHIYNLDWPMCLMELLMMYHCMKYITCSNKISCLDP